MKTFLSYVGLFLAFLFTSAVAIKHLNQAPEEAYAETLVVDNPGYSVEKDSIPVKIAIPSLPIPKMTSVKKTIVLEAKNTVVFRGPVTTESVSEAMRKLQAISEKVSVSTPIYLVLDTPGGSVFDGLDFIDFVNGLPQKVHTITLFAASMGFQIVQNLNNRMITPSGVLMSHRATIGGRSNCQIKGECESRFDMIKRVVDILDYKASKRMGITKKDYEAKIYNEYWVNGYDAIADKAADERVLLRCGKSLQGFHSQEFPTLFGVAKATFSDCPLIKSPMTSDFGDISLDNRAKVKEVMEIMFKDPKQFVKQYIVTDKFWEIFE